MKWIVKWMLCAGALLLVAQVYSGVQLQNFSSALIAALVLLTVAIAAAAFFIFRGSF